MEFWQQQVAKQWVLVPQRVLFVVAIMTLGWGESRMMGKILNISGLFFSVYGPGVFSLICDSLPGCVTIFTLQE